MEENGNRGERRQSETLVDPQEVPRAGYYFEVRSTIRVLQISFQLTMYIAPNKLIKSSTLIIFGTIIISCVIVIYSMMIEMPPSPHRTGPIQILEDKREGINTLQKGIITYVTVRNAHDADPVTAIMLKKTTLNFSVFPHNPSTDLPKFPSKLTQMTYR